MSEIEGKAARVAAMEGGQRQSFKRGNSNFPTSLAITLFFSLAPPGAGTADGRFRCALNTATFNFFSGLQVPNDGLF